MSNPESTGSKGHRVESPDRFARINYERDNGSQEIGLRALAGAAFLLLGRETKPTNPHRRTGITFHHEDGSYDTGTRALANGARRGGGEPPKIYPRTMRPL